MAAEDRRGERDERREERRRRRRLRRSERAARTPLAGAEMHDHDEATPEPR